MTDYFWKILLDLRELLIDCKESIDFVSISNDGGIAINQGSQDAQIIIGVAATNLVGTSNQTLFQFQGNIFFECKQRGPLSATDFEFLLHYMPYCFLPVMARQRKRAISITHFAQTLDGKIATPTGDSKWIGNQENLVHSHRMRALSCAILVGRKTVVEDRPSLTVRLVSGKNPRRVVISSSPCDMSSLLDDEGAEVLVFGKTDQPKIEGLDYNKLDSQNGRINCNTILQSMYEKGVYSVYIEGGAITTSNFLVDKAVDILQLHIAPILFGSGQSAVILPEIDKIKHAIQFKHHGFQQVGDTMMFVGELNREG